jgi:hypothetical protein
MDSIQCSSILRRFKCYGLPASLARDLSNEIGNWEKNSGPKWTVNRLKSLKQDMIRIQIGEEPLTWVKTNKSGVWFGVWGYLRSLAAKSQKGFELAVNCLMVYSLYLPRKVTAQDFSEACESIASERVHYPADVNSTIATHAESIIGTLKAGNSQPLVFYQGKEGTKSPVVSGGSVVQSQELNRDLEWIGHCPENLAFLNKHFMAYRPLLEGLSNDILVEHTQVVGLPSKDTTGGKLCPLTKDGGLKIRWIANPFRIHQWALKPLGEILFETVANLPWDCTFDQTKPYKFVQEHLKKGGTTFCVDLSSATDFFPLDLQLAILRKILPLDEHLISLFEDLSRNSTWTYGKDGVRWTNGQPMGLYPSFPSFALAHGVLLDYLSGGVPNRFFVLGDDVVILHKQTYEKYINMLEVLGCPYNPSKSLVSNKVAEFAGKFIFPDQVISAFKWRDVNSKNFMDLMRTFGQRFKPLLRRRETAVYMKLARFLEPHGCNHSDGPGEPLESVISKTLDFEARIPESGERVCQTSFLRWMAVKLQANHNSSLFSKVCTEWMQEKALAFDEKVQAVFQKTPFSNFPGDRGCFMDCVAEPLKGKLPTVELKKSVDHDNSTLLFYEKLLSQTKVRQAPYGKTWKNSFFKRKRSKK